MSSSRTALLQSRFLKQQPGFIRKQLWVERVDRSMGPWLRHGTCRTMDLIFDC